MNYDSSVPEFAVRVTGVVSRGTSRTGVISKNDLLLKWITRLLQISLDFGKFRPATLDFRSTPNHLLAYVDFAQLL